MGEVKFDDQHPSVDYQPQNKWRVGGRKDVEYNATTHVAGLAGARAIFTFQGSSVSVFGTVGLNLTRTPTVSYGIDESTAVWLQAKPGSVLLFNQLLYKSALLDPSIIHTLTITLEVSRGNGYYIDYFQVTEGTVTTSSAPLASETHPLTSFTSLSPDPQSSSAASRTTQAQLSPFTHSPSSTQSPSPAQLPPLTQSAPLTQSTTPQTETQTPPKGQNNLSRSTIATIAVGSAVVGILLVIVITALFLFRRRSKAKAEKLPSHHSTPFLSTVSRQDPIAPRAAPSTPPEYSAPESSSGRDG